MTVTFMNPEEVDRVIADGEEREDFVESLVNHFTLDEEDDIELEFIQVFEDQESFYGEALMSLFSVDFNDRMFTSGAVEVDDSILRESYEQEQDSVLLDDEYGHRVYEVREV